MIYTVTFNPAIDYVMKTDCIKQGETNRSKQEEIYFGGKGINVSVVLKELGVDSCALGFIAGFTGKALADALGNKGITTDFVTLQNGFTRINVKLKGSEETEINGCGPEIDEDALGELFGKLGKLGKDDTLVLAGSIPSSLPSDIYEKIMLTLVNKSVRFVVDASGKLLRDTLKYKPFLIKPNKAELSGLFGKTLETDKEIIECAKKLRDEGAINVLVSMAGDGSVLIDENGNVHRAGAPKGTVINSVGAGDSMVAGFIAGYSETGDYGYALRLGTAAGSATAFSRDLASREKIDEILKEI